MRVMPSLVIADQSQSPSRSRVWLKIQRNMCLGVFHLGFILFVPLSILAAKDVPRKLPMLKTAFSARADMHPYLLVLLYLGIQCRIHVSGIRIRVFSREEEKHQGGFLELTC